jgi:arsenite-transporting ATPase
MNHFDALKLAMFSGKGGVGKTTLSCGFARRWARQFPNEKILLISTDPAHSLGDVLHMTVGDVANPMADLPNLTVRALNADTLLQEFKEKYGSILELLVERGSFVEGSDLTPVWDLGWPGLDELMGILEIQRLLREKEVDRVVVDMAPSGHTLNLFGLMDFLDSFLGALELFQEKHQVVSKSFTGRYTEDEADTFLADQKQELADGRSLLQDIEHTACLIVAIPEPMSWLESDRLITALKELNIPVGGVFVNHLIAEGSDRSDWQPRYTEQQEMLAKFLHLIDPSHVFVTPEQTEEPVGGAALDRIMTQIQPAKVLAVTSSNTPKAVQWPDAIPPAFPDFMAEGRKLILLGGKGGVGKTTVAAAIAWGMAERYPDKNIRAISIDPAHSLGDAFGQPLGHDPTDVTANLSAQEVDADYILDQFREEYLWELAEMMSGDTGDESLQLAYGPEAWRQIVSQALPGIDEMLSLITVMELLEQGKQDLIVLDTAPTGHLLRFLEMPTAMGDWLSWIFKLWIKYQKVVGRTEFMGRLRTLRKRVMDAQKKLTNPEHTEFIGVMQNQSAILAETARLTDSMRSLDVHQRFVVHNRYSRDRPLTDSPFTEQTLVHLPILPRGIPPVQQIQGAAKLVFE